MPLFSEAIGQQLADYGKARGARQEKGFNLSAQLEHMKRVMAEVDDEIARQASLEEAAQAAQVVPSMAAPEAVATASPAALPPIQFTPKAAVPTEIQQTRAPSMTAPIQFQPSQPVSFSAKPKAPLVPGPLVQRSVSTSGMSEGGRNLAEKTMFGLLSKAPERELDRNRVLLDKMTRARPELLASLYDGDPEIARGYDNEINRLQQSVTAGDAAKERLYIAQLNASQRAAGAYMSAESARARVEAASRDKKEARSTALAIASGKLHMEAAKLLVKESIDKAHRDIKIAQMSLPTEFQRMMAESDPAAKAQMEADIKSKTRRLDATSTSISNAQAALVSADPTTVAEAFEELVSLDPIGEAPRAPDPEQGKENVTGGLFEPGYRERLAKFAEATKAFEEEMAKRGYVFKFAPNIKGFASPGGDGASVRFGARETKSSKKTGAAAKAPSSSEKEIEAAVRAEYAKLGADEATIQTAIKKRIARAKK